MDWLTMSMMKQRGLAQGRSPTTHALTEAAQGKYHHTIGPYSDPVLTVRPGDRVVVETRDAFEGAIETDRDLPSRVPTMPFVNPQNGPIVVEGAEKGDVIAVHIESMAPRGPNSRGTCAMIPQFGALSGTSLTALLAESLPEIVRKIDVDEGGVYWSPRVTLPYRVVGDARCVLERSGAADRHHEVLVLGGRVRRRPLGRLHDAEPARPGALGDFVDPSYTVGAGIEKKYLD